MRLALRLRRRTPEAGRAGAQREAHTQADQAGHSELASGLLASVREPELREPECRIPLRKREDAQTVTPASPGPRLGTFPSGDETSGMGFAHYKTPALDLISYSMKPDEREYMYRLCAMIEQEQDRDRFLRLIRELNDLLERKEHRLEDGPGRGRPDL